MYSARTEFWSVAPPVDTIRLVVVAFADLYEGCTSACTNGFVGRLLKTGYIKTPISGFYLLTFIL